MEKYETYTLEDSDCQRIDLKKNFRSRREILAFTNEIFREVMRQNPGKILYTAETALYPGANSSGNGSDDPPARASSSGS